MTPAAAAPEATPARDPSSDLASYGSLQPAEPPLQAGKSETAQSVNPPPRPKSALALRPAFGAGGGLEILTPFQLCPGGAWENLTARGGVPPYTWTVKSGDGKIPQGIFLAATYEQLQPNGADHNPATFESNALPGYNVTATVMVTDAQGHAAERTFTVDRSLCPIR